MKFQSGLANCHLPGLYSLVISPRDSPWVGMKRIFYAGVDCRMDLWDGADFRLKPHNHRQDIRLTLLFGSAVNVGLRFGAGEIHTFKYKFTSALLQGQFGLERMEDQWCSLRETPLSSTPLFLSWSDVHTVTAAPRSAWLVEELDLAPDGMDRCYSVSHRLSLSSAGLYEPMSYTQLAAMERFFTEAGHAA